DRADTRCGHEQSCGRVRSGDCKDLAIENLDAVEDRQSSLHEVLHNEAHWWRGIKLTGHDLVGTPGEPAGCLAKQNPEGAKQSSDLILELDPRRRAAGGSRSWLGS